MCREVLILFFISFLSSTNADPQESLSAMDSTPGTGIVINDLVTARASVFDIHLIYAGICRHLSRRDIRRCMRVSRGFYVAFRPYLWRKLAITRRSTLEKFQTPECLAALGRNAYYVESITTIYTAVWPLVCTALEIPKDNRNTTIEGAGIEANGNGRGDTNDRPTEPLMRPLSNLHTLHFSIRMDRLSNVCPKLDKMYLIFPLLDPVIAPKLRTLRIENFDYDRKWAVIKCMDRIRQLRTLRRLHIGYRMEGVHCGVLRKIIESIPQVETLAMDVSTSHRSINGQDVQDEAASWEAGSSENSFLRGPSKLPERFAMKNISLQKLKWKELDSVVAFLKRCPNMEKIELSEFLLSSAAHSQLVELLKGWIYLKGLTLAEFILSDDMLAEVIRSASRGHNHSFDCSLTNLGLQQLDPLNMGSSDAAIPSLSSSPTPPSKHSINASQEERGLKSLHILDGIESSYPETSQAIISFHGRTLVSIVLTRSKVVNRADLQRLLCSCPNLETLEAMSYFPRWMTRDPILSTEDILAVSGPAPITKAVTGPKDAGTWGWACTRLRVLSLRYLPRETETGWETGFPYELAVQLGRMRCLEELTLGRMARSRYGPPDQLETVASLVSTLTLAPTSESTPTDISLTGLTSVTRDGDEDPETEKNDTTLSSESRSLIEEEMRTRTESVTIALRILTRELGRLKKLRLGGLRTYVSEEEISRARATWGQDCLSFLADPR